VTPEIYGRPFPGHPELASLIREDGRMLHQSPRTSMRLSVPRGSFLMENRAAHTAASLHGDDRFTVRSSWLHDHLLRHHGRTERETNGLPLADLHRFEHVEQAMGLNGLSHHHPADGASSTGEQTP
jgi:hypothetical protein